MPFARRIINLRFLLDSGSFNAKGDDLVDITGLRVSANVTKAGTASNADCELRIWGMPLSLMNRLTVLNKLAFGEQVNNTVIVSAGDEDKGVSVLFQGTIQEAWVEAKQAPDVMFYVRATSGMYKALKPIPPTSYRGGVDGAVALSGLAQQIGLQFTNHGVTGKIRNPYWPGAAKQQLDKMCQALHCIAFVDDVTHVLHVWPKGQARQDPAILLSPATGLVGYPSYTQNGIAVRSLYNPNLSFGRTVKIESDLLPACGEKVIIAISHNLDANMPGGGWFSEVQCALIGAPLPIAR